MPLTYDHVLGWRRNCGMYGILTGCHLPWYSGKFGEKRVCEWYSWSNRVPIKGMKALSSWSSKAHKGDFAFCTFQVKHWSLSGRQFTPTIRFYTYIQFLRVLAMTDLSALAKCMQEHVDIVTAYINREMLCPLSFIPSKSPTSLNSLPAEVEEARNKIIGLSWSIHQLVSNPLEHHFWTACKVPLRCDYLSPMYHDTVALRVIIERRSEIQS